MEEQQSRVSEFGGPRTQYMTHCDECGKRLWSYWMSGVLCHECHEEMVAAMAAMSEESEE